MNNVKVIVGEEMALQHGLVVSDFTIKMEKIKKKAYMVKLKAQRTNIGKRVL